MTDRQFILIGGAPTTGKSSIAQKLAKHFDLPWISTDQLREIVKPYAEKGKFPLLYDTEGLSAEEFLSRYSPQEIADMEFEQGTDVWPAVKGLLNNNHDWGNGGIVEGVNILPHLVSEEGYRNKNLIKAIFLVDLDEKRMREVVYNRGLYAPAHTYSDEVKEQEVQWAMLFAQRLKREAEHYGFPWVEITKSETDINRVLNMIETPNSG